MFILGMHRSGTSALARVCNLLGVDLGNKFLATNEHNEKGYWEHEDVVNIHDRIFEVLGSSWDDTRPLPDNWWERQDIKSLREELEGVIARDFESSELWGLKDPRQVRLMPLWLEILKEKNIEPAFVITLRDPLSVAKSLEKRDWADHEKALLLWLIYNMDAELMTREYARVFVNYDDMLSDWEKQVKHISKELALPLADNVAQQKGNIEEFLSPSLRHHQKGKLILTTNTKLKNWIEDLEKILSGFAANAHDKDIKRRMDNLADEINNELKNTSDLAACWFREAIANRKRMGEAYTKLHEANLARHEVEKILINKEEAIKNLQRRIEDHHKTIDDLMNSTSWKVTAPLRAAVRALRLTKHLIRPEVYRVMSHIVRSQGIRGLMQQIMSRIADKHVTADKWYREYKPSPKMLVTFMEKKWPEEAPFFSIIMGVYNTREEWLREALDSIIAQTYRKWELVCVNDNSTLPHIKPLLDEYAKKDIRIKVIHQEKNRGVSASSNVAISESKGDYICFMDHDDYLEPQALHRFAEAILADDTDILYSDEILTSEDIEDLQNFELRPQFSYYFYLSHPYFVHFVSIRASIIKEVGGFDESFKVSQDIDLMLKAIEKANKISHVPDILYRWRVHETSLGHTYIGDVWKSSAKARIDHLKRRGFSPEIKEGVASNFYDIDFFPGKVSKVAIIIPTKNRGDLLKTCIDSIKNTTDRKLYDIYVVNHDSNDRETLSCLDSLKKEHTVINYSGPFNFSKLINIGAAEAAKKDYTHYLVLNNDIEAKEPGWLEHMVKIGNYPDVGAVGAILLYPDGVIQHAGVIVGVHGAAEHAHKFDEMKIEGRYNTTDNGSLYASREYSAVTAACMLVDAKVYQKVKGFDEELAVGFGDTDICLRIGEAGYKVMMDPYAVLIHHESVTRGKPKRLVDPHPADSRRFVNRYYDIITSCDPYYNPLLSNISSKPELRIGWHSPEKLKARTVTLKS